MDSVDESSLLSFSVNTNTNQIPINQQTDLSDGDSSDITIPYPLLQDKTSTTRPKWHKAHPST